LEKADVDFVAADMPHANRLTVGIMAMVADEERRMISQRTKAALSAAKKRGVKLGGDRGARLSSAARKAGRLHKPLGPTKGPQTSPTSSMTTEGGRDITQRHREGLNGTSHRHSTRFGRMVGGASCSHGG
jgi:DNA invertase Pin-like site-specific DNA recombinase